jgi:hypothetical protein
MSTTLPVTRALALSGLGGWVAYTAADAIYVFIIPHGAGFAPEIGPLASFIFFAAIFTVFYIAEFVLIGIPGLLILYHFGRALPLWFCGVFGAALFVISMLLWAFIAAACGVLFDSSDRWFILSLASIAGFAAFLVFGLVSNFPNRSNQALQPTAGRRDASI